MSVPLLETPRLILRAHRIDDFADSAAMWADPTVVQFISGTPSTEEQSWSRLLRYGGHWSFLGYGYWVVERKTDKAFLGEVGFADYHRDTTPRFDGKPEAGWVFKSEAHGQGYATEAVTEMLRWADANLDWPSTACMVHPSNAVSIKVARKVGYSNEQRGQYGDREAVFFERPRAA
ncbi:MAG: GNAT family N-acetyltransferase [Pseudomonadota bacterium]